MRAALIYIFLFSASALADGPARTVRQWGMGMALQGRVQADVNPDFYETKALGQLFARARQVPWSVLFELGEEKQRTSSGNFSVSSRSTSMGLWGRYEPWSDYAWSAYVSGGAGVFFDRVETQFGGERSVDLGRRIFVGAGAGIMRPLWRQGLVELEARVQAIEQGRDPALSGLLRVGWVL